MSASSLKLPIVDVFVRRTVATDVALVALAISLLAIAAQVKVMTLPVPITLQTLAVLLIGAVLGTTRGVLATAGYLAAGAAGLPVFSGAQTLAGAVHTTGYLIGFIVAAALIGKFADAGLLSKWGWTILAFGSASALIYVFGVAGLMLSPLQLSFEVAFAAGVAPFLIFDAIKAAIAIVLLPVAWSFVNKSK